jgi:biopolymer transport protein ExbD
MADPKDEEQPATMAHVKQVVRRKLRRAPEHEENFLNIYPMMDMMTILLVFMVMQFSSSSAASIQETDNLRIPYSTSTAQTQDALPVVISRGEVVVDGEKALALRNGQVDPSQKQGGGTGFLISPLYKILKKKAETAKLIASRNTRRPFRGEVQIVADKRTPFRTLAEVVYTLGQAEYKSLRFIVNKKGR